MTAIDTILLDRDGTLIEECHYLSDPDRVRLLPGIADPWRTLSRRGCRFFLVTNQSGIGRGMFSEAQYHLVHDRLQDILDAQRMPLTDTTWCPHAPDAACSCRKPAIGQWQILSERHNLRAARTVMIGDKIADIRFGQNAGCARTVLVLTGHGREHATRLGLPPLCAPVQACPADPSHPSWPTWQARSLGDFLHFLVQQQAD